MWPDSRRTSGIKAACEWRDAPYRDYRAAGR